VARNSEGKRRPELGFRCTRGRESQREEEERIGREREGAGDLIPSSGRRAAARISAGDRATVGSPPSWLPPLRKKTGDNFIEIPLDLGGFSWKLENCIDFAIIGLNLLKKF
jgi:hypothetical protein